MLPVLYWSKEFQNVPLKERQKAAWEARQRAMRHVQFWLAILLMMIGTILGSLIADRFFGGNPGTTLGAVSGFLLGLVWYARTLYRVGMPYYREILSRHGKTAEPCNERPLRSC